MWQMFDSFQAKQHMRNEEKQRRRKAMNNEHYTKSDQIKDTVFAILMAPLVYLFLILALSM